MSQLSWATDDKTYSFSQCQVDDGVTWVKLTSYLYNDDTLVSALVYCPIVRDDTSAGDDVWERIDVYVKDGNDSANVSARGYTQDKGGSRLGGTTALSGSAFVGTTTLTPGKPSSGYGVDTLYYIEITLPQKDGNSTSRLYGYYVAEDTI